jgi:autotransporter-associated beta strand protein
MNNLQRSSIFALSGLLSGVYCFSPSLRAAIRTWDGGGANNNWSTAANWDAAVAAGDDLVFPGGAAVDVSSLNNTNDFAANTPFRSITISGTNYVLNGNLILFTNVGPNAIKGENIGGTNTVNLALRLDAGQTLQTDTSTTILAINGNIDLNGHNLTNFSRGVLRLGGAITGTGNLVKNLAGTLRIEGSTANTFVGTTMLIQGTLELGKSINNGAIPGPLTLGDGIGADVVQYLNSDQIGNNAVVTINVGGELALGTVSDIVGGLVFNGGGLVSSSGSGRLRLNGNITVNAGSTSANIMGGLELLTFDRTITIADGAISPDLIISASISGLGGLVKAGPGELRLVSSNSYSGVTMLNDGFLGIENAFALGATNGGTVVNGDSVLSVLTGTHVGHESLTLNGTGTTNAFPPLGALHALFGSNSWAGPIVLSASSSIGVHTTNDFLTLTGEISGGGGFAKVGAGALRLSGGSPNTFSGTTFVHMGTLLLSKSIPMAIAGDLVVGDDNGGAESDVVRITGPAQIRITSGVTVKSSGLLDLGGSSESIGSLAGTGHVASAGFDFGVGYNNSTTTFAGIIRGSATLIKDGTGTFTLEGNNIYTNTTVVQNGKLIINGTQPQSAVMVSAAELGGRGTIGPALVTAGNLGPGVSPGVLTCSNLTLASSGMTATEFRVELNGAIPGTGYDQVKVFGGVELSGVHLTATLGFPSAASNAFTIIDNDGSDPITNTFNGLSEGATLNVSGTPFRITYAGGTGNDVVLVQLTSFQQPTLTIARSADANVVLAWATNFMGYSLESNTNLNSNVWDIVSPPPSINGTNHVVTNAISGMEKYFRLRAP